MRGVVNDALAVYFLDATVAAAKDVPMAFQVIRSTSDGKVVFVHEQAEQFGTFPFPDFTKNPPDLGHGIECALAALDDQKSGHTAVELIRDRSMLVHMVPISARRMAMGVEVHPSAPQFASEPSDHLVDRLPKPSG